MKAQNQILNFPNGNSYKLLKKIGEGQFGQVYKGQDPKGNFYAIKFIQKSQLESSKNKELLINELTVMKNINHPRILRLLDQAEFNDFIVLVTMYCNNGNLKDNLEIHEKTSGEKGLGEQKSKRILIQIIEGFKALKQDGNKIMHRDLKLANIFVNNNEIVIGDFGFAKLGESLTYTKLGTPLYMAPEVLQFMQDPKKQYDSKCDIWSIGVCFYELIFGCYPFEANSEKTLLNKMIFKSGQNLKFPKHQKISVETQILLKQMLESNPKARKSFQELFNMINDNDQQNQNDTFKFQNEQYQLQNSRFKNSQQNNNLQISQSKRTANTDPLTNSNSSKYQSFQNFQFSHNFDSQSRSSQISGDQNSILKQNLIPYFYYKNLVIFMVDTTKIIAQILKYNISELDIVLKGQNLYKFYVGCAPQQQKLFLSQRILSNIKLKTLSKLEKIFLICQFMDYKFRKKIIYQFLEQYSKIVV